MIRVAGDHDHENEPVYEGADGYELDGEDSNDDDSDHSDDCGDTRL